MKSQQNAADSLARAAEELRGAETDAGTATMVAAEKQARVIWAMWKLGRLLEALARATKSKGGRPKNSAQPAPGFRLACKKAGIGKDVAFRCRLIATLSEARVKRLLKEGVRAKEHFYAVAERAKNPERSHDPAAAESQSFAELIEYHLAQQLEGIVAVELPSRKEAHAWLLALVNAHDLELLDREGTLALCDGLRAIENVGCLVRSLRDLANERERT
jgi:hypothetical protein